MSTHKPPLCAGTHKHRAHSSDNEVCSIDPPTAITQPPSYPTPFLRCQLNVPVVLFTHLSKS